MTEKEKAEAYDEAIERAKKLYGNGIIEEIFPELKEDDTERIRKNCIHFLELQKQHHAATFEIEECIAWLEKQGKKSTAKIEPRFKVGDWVVFITSESVYQVEKKENYEYTLRDIHGGSFCVSFSNEELIREWNIQDVKDGDVLSFYSEYKGNKILQVGIIEKYVGKHGGCSNTFKIHVGVNWDNNLQIGGYMGCPDIHPATKEQRDALMKAIKDAGYEWDAENKELKTYKVKLNINEITMATIKEEEYPIKDNGFEYLGNHYDCHYAIERDIKMILQEAETSHKDKFNEFYDRNTLRPDKIRIFVDKDNVPIYGIIIYLIDYRDGNNSRYACGGYYRFEFDNSILLPHPYQESICW